MPLDKPAKTTDRRRGKKKPPPIKQPSLAEVDKIYEEAAAQPWTPLFNDRRG